MMSAFATALAAAALLTGLTTAAPTSTTDTAPAYPSHSYAQNFNLIANVTNIGSSNFSVQNYAVQSYHLGAGTAAAVLALSSDANRPFYQNGTDSVHITDVLSDGGTPPFPEGFIVDTTLDSEGRNGCYVNAGAGTTGVQITRFPDPVSRLEYAGGQFYACTTLLLGGPQVQVFWRAYGEVTPDGCAEITLFPQCEPRFDNAR